MTHPADDSETMPQSFLTDPESWDAFVGRAWRAALAPLGLRKAATVVEIAPGSSAKIGYALAGLGFEGTLHLVDSSPAALDAALPKYRSLLPHATLHLHACTLEAALPALPRQPDALLASHMLDDLLLARAPQASGDTFGWATQYSPAISPATLAAWQVLSADAGELARHVADTAAGIAAALALLAPRHAVLSQYPSATLQDGGLGGLNEASAAALAQLRGLLQADHRLQDVTPLFAALPRYNNPHIARHLLNGDYWLSCTRRP